MLSAPMQRTAFLRRAALELSRREKRPFWREVRLSSPPMDAISLPKRRKRSCRIWIVSGETVLAALLVPSWHQLRIPVGWYLSLKFWEKARDEDFGEGCFGGDFNDYRSQCFINSLFRKNKYQLRRCRVIPRLYCSHRRIEQVDQ